MANELKLLIWKTPNKNQEGKLWERQWTFKSYFGAELLTVSALSGKEGLICNWLSNNVFDRSTVFIFRV